MQWFSPRNKNPSYNLPHYRLEARTKIQNESVIKDRN